MRVTLGQALASNIPTVLNMCADDPRVINYINEATEIIVKMGKYWGTYQKYRICTNNGCLTWPRQIAAILTMAVCKFPVKQRNEWFEFLENGWGLRDENSCDMQNFNRAEGVGVCSFEDMASDGSEKIKVYADVPEAAGARILLRGNDENGNWIRTLDGATWVDGEYVNIDAATPQVSTKFFSTLVNVIKPVTNGVVRLYKYEPVTPTQTAMAIYEPDEEHPNYRRTFLPNLPLLNSTGSTCEQSSVTVMAKMEFIPARVANDYLIIGNIPALKDMCMAIKKREDNLWDIAAKYEASAISRLEQELSHYLGNNNVIPINFESPATWGAGVSNCV